MIAWLILAVLAIIVACTTITVQTGEGHDSSKGIKRELEVTKGDTTIKKEKQ